MNYFNNSLTNLLNWIPFSLSLLIGVFCLFGIQKFFEFRSKKSINGTKIYYQLTLFFLINVLIVVLIINTPLSEGLKGQLLSLLGITFTAAIALSSTTFLGNIMVGLMIKVLGKFKPGDFLRIDSHFGRVTELGLLHTEIQTQDRDLTTLPNLFLVSNPVKVIRSSGTVLSEELSLGYDIHHNRIEKSLIRAAKKCGLEDPFMHIQKLGDYSVTYRISGFMKDVKSILSTKASFREEILDSLHQDKIEIISPTFMNQRVFENTKAFVPKYERDAFGEQDEKPEELIFDKAEEAESVERLKELVSLVDVNIKNLENNQELTKEEIEVKEAKLLKRKEKLLTLIKEKS